MENIEANQNSGSEDNPEIAFQLLVMKTGFKSSNQEIIVEIEVHPKGQNAKADKVGD